MQFDALLLKLAGQMERSGMLVVDRAAGFDRA
jgi:hypothetical protein